MELVYKGCDYDDVEMGVSNPMDKYYNVIEKETEFINPLSRLKQQRKGTEESSSTLSASPPEIEPGPRIRSMPILSVLSDVSSFSFSNWDSHQD